MVLSSGGKRRPLFCRLGLALLAVFALTIAGMTSAASATATSLPGKPTSVAASIDAPNHLALLQWASPAVASGVLGYEVSRDGVDTTGYGAWTGSVSAAADSETFIHLAAGSTYHLSVRAITAAGTGPAATALVVVGGVGVTGAPSYVSTAITSGSTLAVLSWLPPAGTGEARLVGYRVGRDGADSNGYGAWSDDLLLGRTAEAFTHLVTGATYHLSIQTITDVSYGPTSTVTIVA